jgi:hypothetical protein
MIREYAEACAARHARSAYGQSGEIIATDLPQVVATLISDCVHFGMCAAGAYSQGDDEFVSYWRLRWRSAQRALEECGVTYDHADIAYAVGVAQARCGTQRRA